LPGSAWADGKWAAAAAATKEGWKEEGAGLPSRSPKEQPGSDCSAGSKLIEMLGEIELLPLLLLKLFCLEQSEQG
jgi:hypothetical protein